MCIHIRAIYIYNFGLETLALERPESLFVCLLVCLLFCCA